MIDSRSLPFDWIFGNLTHWPKEQLLFCSSYIFKSLTPETRSTIRIMESLHEQQTKQLRQLQHGRNHHRAHPNYYHHHQKNQFQENINKYAEKKNGRRNKRYNKNRNRNEASDGSVGTASSSEVSTNNRDGFRPQCQNNIDLDNSTTNRNGRSKKDYKKKQHRNQFSSHKYNCN